MKTVEIPLTQGQVAIIDEKHFSLINQYKWHAWWCSHTKSFYARRGTNRTKTELMHRLILNATDPNVFVDHLDHNTLNNTEENLRLVTNSQNQMNRKKKPNTTSTHKGVYFHKHRKKWLARITVNGERKTLGYFQTESEAALCYNEFAINLFGQFALLNTVN
jgi:hypothetical protein